MGGCESLCMNSSSRKTLAKPQTRNPDDFYQMTFDEQLRYDQTQTLTLGGKTVAEVTKDGQTPETTQQTTRVTVGDIEHVVFPDPSKKPRKSRRSIQIETAEDTPDEKGHIKPDELQEIKQARQSFRANDRNQTQEEIKDEDLQFDSDRESNLTHTSIKRMNYYDSQNGGSPSKFSQQYNGRAILLSDRDNSFYSSSNAGTRIKPMSQFNDNQSQTTVKRIDSNDFGDRISNQMYTPAYNKKQSLQFRNQPNPLLSNKSRQEGDQSMLSYNQSGNTQVRVLSDSESCIFIDGESEYSNILSEKDNEDEEIVHHKRKINLDQLQINIPIDQTNVLNDLH